LQAGGLDDNYTRRSPEATGGHASTLRHHGDSYSAELDTKMTPELAAQVAEYSTKYYQDAPSSNQSQEVLAELKEGNDENAKQYQWLKPEEYADVEARIGKVMTHEEFIYKLRRAGLTCFYKQHPQPDKAVLFVSRTGFSEAEVACWAQIGQMPELSIMNFDRYGIPLAERRRGWRTCLLQLMLKEMITEEMANRIFGKPRSDAAFDRYNATVQEIRKIHTGVQ
jgi:hypothetical protein